MGYRTQSLDTTLKAELYLFDLWRSWSSLKKLSHLNYTTYSTRLTAWYLAQTQAGSLEKHHTVTYFLKKIGEPSLISLISPSSQDLTMLGVIEEALIVTKILKSLNIPYFIGGSVASGMWGELRYTQDLDIVADIQAHQVSDLVRAFSPRFYISDDAVREAIEYEGSFNAIDNDTGWKVDIFILSSNPFYQQQFQRKQILCVDDQANTLWFSSAEDIILQKIVWYRLSQKQSEQQWRDILGVLKLQGKVLDIEYLRNWAHFLGIDSDLEKALSEANY